MFNLRFERLKSWTKSIAFPERQAENRSHSKGSDLEDYPPETDEIKKLARDLLSGLSGKRIDIEGGRLKFMDGGRHGSGGKGDVVVATIIMDGSNATLHEDRPVAVKKLKFSHDADKEKLLKAFVNELRVLDKLSHQHIVEMIGFVEQIENGDLWLVFPWESNGNVREFLRSGEWEIPERVSLIQDVAAGLEYLHTREPPICHGDLKSLNVLVNDSYYAIITDFGSARVMKEDGRTNREDAPTMDRTDSTSDSSWQIDLAISDRQLTLTGPSWSLRWAAPEILNGQEPDLPGDVWALGWICWEIMTDNYPFPETNGEGLITLMVTGGQLPSMDAHDQLSQIRSLCSIMLKCWKAVPTKRPSAVECRRSLTWIPATIPAARESGKSSVRSAALLLQLGEMHWIHGRPDEAAKTLEQGLTIAQSTNDKQLLAAIMTTLGQVHQDRGQYTEAEKRYTQASEIFTSIGNDWGRANVLKGLGEVQQSREKYAEAEERYNQALEIYTEIGADRGRAHVLHGLGDLQQMGSRYARAEECYTQALEIYTSIGDELGRGHALKGLGDVHQLRSNYAEAEEQYTLALEVYTNIGNDLGRANVLDWLGDVQRMQLKFAEADDCYTQALKTYMGIGNQRGQTNSSMGLGEIRLRQARYAEAKVLITDAAKMAERDDYEWGTNRCRDLLAEVLDAEKSSAEPTTSTSIPALAATGGATAS